MKTVNVFQGRVFVSQKQLTKRVDVLCTFCHRYTPDVVFLQELIPQYVQYLKKRAVSYQIVEGNECKIQFPDV